MPPGTRAPRPPWRRTCAAAPSGPRGVRGSPGAGPGPPTAPRDSRGRRAPAPRAPWTGFARARPAPPPPHPAGPHRRARSPRRPARRRSRSRPTASPRPRPLAPRAVRRARAWPPRPSIARSHPRAAPPPRSRAPDTRGGPALALARGSRSRGHRAPPGRRASAPTCSRYAASATRCASPANRSRKPVCVADDSRRCAWCCPCTSTNDAPSSASVDAVASCPPTRAALFPSAPTERARRTSPSSAQSAACSVASNRAWTRAACAPGANERAVGSDAQRERQADRHHGLAGPGLSREDVQAGMQLEIEVVDDPETADVQLPQHARSLSRSCRHHRRPRRSDRPGARTCPAPVRGTAGHRDVAPGGRAAPPLRCARGSRPAARRSRGRRPRAGRVRHPRPRARRVAARPGRTSDRTPCARRSASAPGTATSGLTIGPRAENEYAVDPVGVATTTPSAENVVTYSPSTSTARRTRRCRARFSTMISFSAHCGANSAPPSAHAVAASRSSMVARPARRVADEVEGVRRLHLRQEPEPSHLHAQGRDGRAPPRHGLPAGTCRRRRP